ncbi:MAG: hypothetical protein K2N18_01135, partial [Clostridia bacterium]|nr:hypothetical protein [Clostridia bacterium]
MAKFRKKLIFVVILALCLATCLTLVACNPKPSATADYSVTVKIGDAPQSGVSVKLAKDGAEITQVTGTDGKASFELEKGTYTVSLSNLPEHYVVPSTATLTVSEENPDLTITLEKEFAYVVKLVNADGTAFTQSGVRVQICNTETLNCCNPVDIDANGVAYIYGWDKAKYNVAVLNLNGYAYECDEHDYYIVGENHNLTATITELTIKVYPIVALEKENGTALSPEEKDELGLDAAAVAYKYSKELAAGEKIYYSLTSELSGKFSVYAKKYTAYNADLGYDASILNYYSQGEHFILGVHLLNLDYAWEDTLTADTPFYYYADNISNQTLTAEFIIVYPNASYNKFNDVNGKVTVTAAKDDAFIEFHPTQAGHYTFTLSNPDATIEFEEGSANSYAVFPENDAEAVPTLHVKVLADYLNGILDPLSVRIHVEGDTATEVVVTITKVEALAHDATVVQPSANIPQATKPDETNGKLELVHIGFSTQIVKGTDGYYHIGSATGDIVYIMLTKPLDTWSLDGSLAYLELASKYG